MAIVVDLRKPSRETGAIYVHDERGGWLGIAGLDCAGFNVIVPWEAGWELISYGTSLVGLARERPSAP